MTPAATAARFEPRMVDGLDEPVRRYLLHALAPGAPLSRGIRLEVSGRIRVGVWMRFASEWEGDGRSFSWRAIAGPGATRLLRVHDRFADGAGSMDVRLRSPHRWLPAPRLLHVESADVARSGAGRAALEAVWAPASLLPERGVTWHAESDDTIVATWPVPPEAPELRITIGPDGAVRSQRALRWRSARVGYLPFGTEVHGERTFGAFTVPSSLTAGWGDGRAWAPFFEAVVTRVDPVDRAPRDVR